MAVLAVVAGAAIALVVVLRVSGGHATRSAAPDPVAPAASAAIRMDPLSYRRQGLRLARPVTWTAQRARGVIRLRSPTGLIGIVILTAPHRIRAVDLQHETETQIVRSSPSLRLLFRRRAVLGGDRARQSELLRTQPGGRRVEVLLVVARRRYRTYAVTVFNRSPRPASRTPAVRAVLDSFRTFRPAH